MKNITEKIAEMTAEEKRAHIDGVEFCLDYACGSYVTDEEYALYEALIEERAAMKAKETLVEEAKTLAETAPDGFVTDGDTLLCDIMENADFEVTGLAADIFNIWLKSSDRLSVEKLFYTLTDTEFEDFVNLCIEKTTRRD